MIVNEHGKFFNKESYLMYCSTLGLKPISELKPKKEKNIHISKKYNMKEGRKNG